MSSLYDRLGGAAAVDAAVDVFYRKVLADANLESFFDDVDMEGQRDKQKAFLTMAFGGPHHYSGKDLRDAHAGLVKNGLNDTHFDAVATQEGLREFALYHKAMALASIGDFEGAEVIFADNNGAVARFSRRAALARTEVLSQLDRNEDAIQFLDDVFVSGSDPTIEAYTGQLTAGETLPFTHAGSALDGMAEIFFTVGV